MSLGRAWKLSGIETEMWKSSAYRSLGVWEKRDHQGCCRVRCFTTTLSFVDGHSPQQRDNSYKITECIHSCSGSNIRKSAFILIVEVLQTGAHVSMRAPVIPALLAWGLQSTGWPRCGG